MSDNEEKNEMNTETIDSKYRKILIAAKRSKQIQKGARPRVDLPNAKPTRIALEEVDRGLVDFELTERVEN
ncbi:MAG: DNA-directed RNA polymerase subunit omega [Acidobacteriota bacterium]|nr:MAG: DNA-directed RNA polymerase subunit omega [Acidobacteriota bacterium]